MDAATHHELTVRLRRADEIERKIGECRDLLLEVNDKANTFEVIGNCEGRKVVHLSDFAVRNFLRKNIEATIADLQAEYDAL